jgi:hypothetical protein
MECVSCKGKLKCGRQICPFYLSSESMFKIDNKNEFSGNTPPSIFIGSKLRYPEVNVGILNTSEKVEDAWLYDAEKYWADNNFDIRQVIFYRSNLINSRFKAKVQDVRTSNKLIDLSQQVGMSIKPIDVEVELKNKISVKINFNDISLPMGPAGILKKIKITSDPKIPGKIDKVVDDTDLKAVEAIDYLYKNQFDEYRIQELLSVGVLGLRKNRKLVPTRFSITAIDDSIGKILIKNVKEYSLLNEYRLFYGNYLGNHFLIMMFPEIFSYELFESFLPGSAWNISSNINTMTDYEDFYGRKNYAENCGGGYYASRFGILEYLNKIRRQGSILVLRYETPEYWASLGVWVVREAIKKTLQNECFIFKNKEEMIEYGKNMILGRLGYDISDVFKKSRILNNVKEQKKLMEFL